MTPGRVQQLPRPRLAVLVDGWIELPIHPPETHRDRRDLVIERRTGPRQTELDILTGDHLGRRPDTPDGCRALAEIQVQRADMAIMNSMIWDYAISPPPEDRQS